MWFTIMLRVRGDHTLHAHPHTRYVTKPAHQLCSVDEFLLQPDVLPHSPENLSIRTCVRAIPSHQLQRRGHVLGNRFLR